MSTVHRVSYHGPQDSADLASRPGFPIEQHRIASWKSNVVEQLGLRCNYYSYSISCFPGTPMHCTSTRYSMDVSLEALLCHTRHHFARTAPLQPIGTLLLASESHIQDDSRLRCIVPCLNINASSSGSPAPFRLRQDLQGLDELKMEKEPRGQGEQ